MKCDVIIIDNDHFELRSKETGVSIRIKIKSLEYIDNVFTSVDISRIRIDETIFAQRINNRQTVSIWDNKTGLQKEFTLSWEEFSEIKKNVHEGIRHIASLQSSTISNAITVNGLTVTLDTYQVLISDLARQQSNIKLKISTLLMIAKSLPINHAAKRFITNGDNVLVVRNQNEIILWELHHQPFMLSISDLNAIKKDIEDNENQSVNVTITKKELKMIQNLLLDTKHANDVTYENLYGKLYNQIKGK